MWLLRVLRVGEIVSDLLPARVGYALCRLIGLLLFLTDAPARRHILANLRRVEPDAPPSRRLRHAVSVFITVVTNYYDLVRLRGADHARVLEMFDIRGAEHLEEARRRGRGVVVLSAHLGNYNVVARCPVAMGFRTAVVAEEVEPPELFDYVTRLRSAHELDVFPPSTQAIRPILRLLRQNGLLLIAGDRDVVGHHMIVPFFGEPAALPPGPVLLAMRTGAALVPAFTIRRAPGRSLAVIEPPLELVRTGDWESDLRSNMAIMARTLERMIAVDPSQWAVLQQVWPEKAAETARAASPRTRREAARALSDPGDATRLESGPGRR